MTGATMKTRNRLLELVPAFAITNCCEEMAQPIGTGNVDKHYLSRSTGRHTSCKFKRACNR
jgi:hypothetical protein